MQAILLTFGLVSSGKPIFVFVGVIVDVAQC